MQLIAYPDFLKRFPEGESVVFVGNAPSIKEEGLGDWIDSHDVVVRFNESPVKGYEKDTGTRTDILVSNPYPENRAPFVLSERGILLIISPQTRRLPSPQFESWVREHSVLFTYAPDIVQVGDINHKASLTTGTYGLHLLSRLLKPSRVGVTGFTMFLEDTACHYWQPNAPSGLHAHDILTEASIFISICNALRCDLEITEDIQWVARRVHRALRKSKHLISLKNKKWRE